MYRAVALPQDHPCILQLLLGQSAVRLVRVVDHAVIERQAEIAHRGVAAEVLIGQEQHLLALLECPREAALGIARGAHGTAVPTREGLDGGGRVHVGDGHRDVGNAGCLERGPAVLDLRDAGHVGHGAAGGEIGEDHLLAR